MYLGDDGSQDDVAENFDTGSPGTGAPCAAPAGTYTVTATPTADSGAGCPTWTSTMTFPPPAPDGNVNGCTYTPTGTLPICVIDFQCTVDNGEDTANTTGFIEVFNASLAGSEDSVVTADNDGGAPSSTCDFHLSYTLQQ